MREKEEKTAIEEARQTQKAHRPNAQGARAEASEKRERGDWGALGGKGFWLQNSGKS